MHIINVITNKSHRVLGAPTAFHTAPLLLLSSDKDCRLTGRLQDALFFAPKLYKGTARGRKKGKTMQKPSGARCPDGFSYSINYFSAPYSIVVVAVFMST